MNRHNAAVPRQQLRQFDSGDESLEDRNIYAFIAEITKVGNAAIPVGLPIIALCDTNSETNWVSSKLVEELLLSAQPPAEYKTHTSGRRKSSKSPRIIIRWSCGKLGQYSEESTFFIEPKAEFKMMFGCAYSTASLPAERPRSLTSHYTPRKSRKKEKVMPLSENATDGLLQGIEDGTLLRLKRLPPVSTKKHSRLSVADLETDLKYVHASYSLTEHALDSCFVDDNSSPCDRTYAEEAFNGLEISSIQDGSETDTEYHPQTESTNTSISEDPAYHFSSIAHKLQREERSPWVIKSWANQRIEEGPWTARAVQLQPERSIYSFRQCQNLSSKQQSALAAAKAAALKETAEYWTWDEEAKQYKHFDEGCTEPVWYNPPRAVVK